eukprot:CAMPEP_0117025286 /NCGR_PEP_ID=MMETSP0472-20121206/18694_1 /TAXON_ID=693140 ORGANISM="Tiarina fusus, Strain LIS" /NCGR_SAMPLE_ID=MMETSP0472 /ASSEMBLY_ACC=CAM_ASM_000603 /LENGTH=296 /DNA_ID=CAMNT_0004731959 /DNA_START=31 /DNA_END=921 /DNA_ORIENTATION=-
MTHRYASYTGDSMPSMAEARDPVAQDASEPSSSYVAELSFFSRRTLSSSGSSYPSLLFPRHRSIEDSLLLYDVPKEKDEEDTSIFRDVREDKSSSLFGGIRDDKSSSIFSLLGDKSTIFSRGVLEDKSSIFRGVGDEDATSSIFGDVGEDETATSKSHASSYSFSSVWGACGMSDQVPPPKEVLLWLREQVDQLMERRKGRSKQNSARRKVQHEWGAKPSVDELSACSASSASSSSASSTESTPTKGPSHAFVDSDSTSWEATDNDDSLADSRYLPDPTFRKAAPHSQRKDTRYLV